MSRQFSTATRVAEPLVRQLVHDDAEGAGRRSRGTSAGSGSPARTRGAGRWPARRWSRTGSRRAGSPASRRPPGYAASAASTWRGLALGSCRDTATYHGRPSLRPCRTAKSPGREERQVGRHRLARPASASWPGRPWTVRDDAAPVGDHLHRPRHGDVDVHPRPVARVVVGREPPRRHVRLVHRDDLGVVGEPVALAGVRRPAGPAGVLHPDPEPLPVEQRGRGDDPQLVAARPG